MGILERREAANRALKNMEEKKRGEAATTVQAAWRGRQARKEAADRRNAKLEVKEKEKRDKAARKELERQATLASLEEENRIKDEERRQQREAAMRLLEEMEENKKGNSVMMIQRMWRAKQERRRKEA